MTNPYVPSFSLMMKKGTSVLLTPSVPVSVTATPGFRKIIISWAPVAGADSYNIYYGSATGVTKLIGTLIAGAASGYEHVLADTVHKYYIVTAVNGFGESAESVEVNATTTTPTWATFDPAAKSARITLSNGNLTVTGDGTNNDQLAKATQYKSVGKWYCEFTITAIGANSFVGFANLSENVNAALGVDSNGVGYRFNGLKFINNGFIAYGVGYTTGDIVSLLLDADADTCTCWKNGLSQGVIFSSATGNWTVVMASRSTATSITANFGASAFTYPPPAGYTGWWI